MLLVYYPPKEKYTLVTKNAKIIPRRHPYKGGFFSLHDPLETFHIQFFQIRTSPSLFPKNQNGVLGIHCEFVCVLSWCTPLLTVILNDVRLNRMKLTTEILKRNFWNMDGKKKRKRRHEDNASESSSSDGGHEAKSRKTEIRNSESQQTAKKRRKKKKRDDKKYRFSSITSSSDSGSERSPSKDVGTSKKKRKHAHKEKLKRRKEKRRRKRDRKEKKSKRRKEKELKETPAENKEKEISKNSPPQGLKIFANKQNMYDYGLVEYNLPLNLAALPFCSPPKKMPVGSL